jgi:heme-degrading monooxygenase HmoA
MFTRIVEITAKAGKSHELANTIHEKVLPILKKQSGFVGETVLLSETEPDRIAALSFWNKREYAERYHNKDYKTVRETLQHLLEVDPVVRTFNVHSSTSHKIAASKAA